MQQINDTEILMEQPYMLIPKQLELKDKQLKQIEHTIQLRLPILKDAPKRDLAQSNSGNQKCSNYNSNNFSWRN